MYKLPEGTKPDSVTLKVQNLEKMTEFYHRVIGLTVLEKDDNMVLLGAENSQNSLIKLKQIPVPEKVFPTAGLYHIAFLLPTRKDLGNVILWLLQNNIELGAGDHGYSEAIYLSDPEENGIEIYHDRPIEKWDIRSNGEIAGVTEELDGDAIVAEADGLWQGMPAGTGIGHVHLQVRDLEETAGFFEALGFDLKYNFGRQAKFFAAGLYHHHLGTNVWNGRNLPKMRSEQFGLEGYSFYLPEKSQLEELAEALNLKGITFERGETSLQLKDPNGLIVTFR